MVTLAYHASIWEVKGYKILGLVYRVSLGQSGKNKTSKQNVRNLFYDTKHKQLGFSNRR